MSKPSERVIENEIDGKEVTDSKGRVLKLKKPGILDMYDLMSALGEDAKNPACTAMATHILYVAFIDGKIIQAPKSYSEIRAKLQQLGEEGMSAVSDFLGNLQVASEKEQIENVKK